MKKVAIDNGDFYWEVTDESEGTYRLTDYCLESEDDLYASVIDNYGNLSIVKIEGYASLPNDYEANGRLLEMLSSRVYSNAKKPKKDEND